LLVATAGVDDVNVSSVYRTTPVGPVTDQPDFHNLVLVVETDVTPQRLLERANAVEQELGRVRTIDGGPRTIDVDIVAISDEVIDTAT
ncbi:2-amino-4-hydroxy-6-hydroxymethyldihydropteridine diphosphokinase, partial [Pseudomonas sp. FW305-3-2-15-C-TSA3]